MANKDYYAILEVNKNASTDEIKKSYRKLVKKWHPDANPNNRAEAEAKIKEINEAYEVLSNDQKRQMYDQYGTADPSGAGFSGGNPFGSGFYQYSNGGFSGFEGFGDIFDDIGSMFGFGGRSRRSKNGPSKGESLKYEMQLTFEEAFSGVTKEFNILRNEKCKTCNGSGAKPGTKPETCDLCNGKGFTVSVQNTFLGTTQVRTTCNKCHGTGKMIKEICEDCLGKGEKRKQATLKVKIPAGIDNGQTVVLRGEGEPGRNGGENGDIYINVSLKKHKIFTRKGANIYCDVPITFTQATLGAELDIPLVDGKTMKYKIPEGTQPGTTFTINDKGFNNLNVPGKKGNLLFTVIVQVPKRLTKEQRTLLTELAKTMNEQPPIKKRGFFS